MTQVKQCIEPGCVAEFPNHRWGSVRAHDDGWFLQKSGEAWCPEHTPVWVAGWRKEQGTAHPAPDSRYLVATCRGCVQPIRKLLGEGQTWVHVDTEKVDCETP